MVNFSKIPEQWDAVPSLRRRAAKGRSLLVSATTGIKQILGNVKNIAENYEVLKPIVETMTNVGNIETPASTLFRLCSWSFMVWLAIPRQRKRPAWRIKTRGE